MLLKKSNVYAIVLGFNVFVICITFLLWYFFIDFDVKVITSPRGPTNGTNTVNENNISKFPWIIDAITKYGGLGTICTPHIPSYACDYHIPLMKVYQINSIVQTLRLEDMNPSIPFSIYSGYFDHNGIHYNLSLQTNVSYLEFLITALASSVIGSVTIVVVSKKLPKSASN